MDFFLATLLTSTKETFITLITRAFMKETENRASFFQQQVLKSTKCTERKFRDVLEFEIQVNTNKHP